MVKSTASQTSVWVLALLVVACLGYFARTTLMRPSLEEQLESLNAHWTDSPQWRTPLAAVPGGNITPVYHITLKQAGPSHARDLQVLRHKWVRGYLDGFDAHDCLDFDDRSLKYLTGAEHLRGLVLEGTSVTDRGAEIIAKNFPNLLIVDLEDTKVTQAGVESILKGHDLAMIDLSGLTINKTSLTAFARTHAPSTVIKFSAGEFTDHPESAFDRLPFP